MPDNKNINADDTDRAIDTFVSKMITDKGLDALAPDMRARLHAQLREKLDEQIDQAAIRMLSNLELLQFEQLVEDENTTPSQVEAFFDNAGVDYGVAAEQAMLAFRDAFLREEI